MGIGIKEERKIMMREKLREVECTKREEQKRNVCNDGGSGEREKDVGSRI